MMEEELRVYLSAQAFVCVCLCVLETRWFVIHGQHPQISYSALVLTQLMILEVLKERCNFKTNSSLSNLRHQNTLTASTKTPPHLLLSLRHLVFVLRQICALMCRQPSP